MLSHAVQAVILADPGDARCTAFWAERNAAASELIAAGSGKVRPAQQLSLVLHQHQPAPFWF